MKNCETCGIEVVIVMTPFADECTGFIGENGVTCFKCDSEREANEYEDAFSDADEYGPGGIYEDPAVAYERERGEAFQDRVDMWRREY